ncbi:MAG: hypothetical protein Q7T30_01040, partial [Planctomycetota bacterium]|nr:hypothetical protein [Planctomycetota bacterium]
RALALRAPVVTPPPTPVAPPRAAPAASPPPGTIIVNNDEGEVHFHFHGPAPTIVTNKPEPARAAQPAEPRRVRALLGGPAGPTGPGSLGPATAGPSGPAKAPTLDTPIEVRRAYVKSTQPEGKAMLLELEPAKAKPKKDKSKEEAPKSERKINDEELPLDVQQAMAVGNFVQVLLGAF